jgi:ABC-type transport system substrate-binding protein
MFAAAAAEPDQAKREQLELQMSKYVFDKAYMAPLLAPNTNWGMSKDLDFKPLSTEVLFLSRIRFAN